MKEGIFYESGIKKYSYTIYFLKNGTNWKHYTYAPNQDIYKVLKEELPLDLKPLTENNQKSMTKFIKRKTLRWNE